MPVLLAAVALCFAVGCPVPTPSDGAQTGACCSEDGSCVETTQADCESAGGTYQGDGTSCTPNPCEVAATGACCATDGTCSETTQADCESAGGTYQGDGTSCTPNPCEAPGPDGATLYANNCATCHGSDGSGPPDIRGSTAGEITTKINAGGLHAGASGLSEPEIAAIADFLSD